MSCNSLAFYSFWFLLVLASTGVLGSRTPREAQNSLYTTGDSEEISKFDDDYWTDYCLSSSWTQSPVQLSSPLHYLEFDPEFTFTLQDDGEWQVENELLTLVNDWGSIEADGTTYVIYEIRLTSPSEHTVGSSGYYYPLELQAIAVSAEGTYLGLITFFEEGEQNDFLTGVGLSKTSGIVDLQEGDILEVSEYYSLSWLFEDGMKLLYYDGSLTFPPCNEILWVISYDVQSASKAQINSFPSELVGYVREIQTTDSTNDYDIFINFDISQVLESSSSSDLEGETNYEANELIDLNAIKDSEFYDNTDRYIIYDDLLKVEDLVITVESYETLEEVIEELDSEIELDDEIEYSTEDEEEDSTDSDSKEEKPENSKDIEYFATFQNSEELPTLETEEIQGVPEAQQTIEVQKTQEMAEGPEEQLLKEEEKAEQFLEEIGSQVSFQEFEEIKEALEEKGFSFLELGKMRVGGTISEENRQKLYEMQENKK